MATNVGDVIRIAAKQTYASVHDIVNAHHFVVIATPTPNTNVALMQDVSEKLSLAWDEIKADTTSGQVPAIIEGYNITQDFPLGQISWPGPYTAGTATGDAMPTDDCALVLWGTDVKRRQGRTYLGVFTEAQHSGSRWTAGLQSDIALWALQLRDENPLPEGSELRLVVYSKSAGAHSLITSVRVQPVVAQQERRKLGRGS